MVLVVPMFLILAGKISVELLRFRHRSPKDFITPPHVGPSEAEINQNVLHQTKPSLLKIRS